MNRNDIPIGKANAVTRSQLCIKWGCNDREARRVIALYRSMNSNDGYAILSTSDGSGYWRSNDPVEIRRFINEAESRARNVFLSISNAKKVLRGIENAGQMTICPEGES